jgi:MSHA pilin protein MshC
VTTSGHAQSGFSLVELIVVLILVGLLSVIAMAKLSDRTSFEALGYFNQVQALTRYAQKVAVGQRRSVFVVDNAGAIAVCYDAACAAAVADPAGSCGLAASPPSGVAYAFSAGSFSFDGLGRPSPNSSHAITITASGEPARVVTIEAETGYVHQ